jgi:hypothetical protein
MTEVEALAATLQRRHPELALEQLRCASRAPRETIDPAAACIHVDDFAGIAMPPGDPLAHACYGSRAFARARAGDLVASHCVNVDGRMNYLETRLGFGRPRHVVVAERPGAATNLYAAMIDDPQVLRAIGAWARERGGPTLLHPYMGDVWAWRLAAALDQVCEATVAVLAPAPALTRLINDRLWFAELVRLVLGPELALVSHAASSVAEIVQRMLALAESSASIAVHLSNSATGAGLARFVTEDTRRLDLLDERLATWTAALGWNPSCPAISVERWEPDVLASPSVQTWIPSPIEGAPIIDGIFDQRFDPRDPAVFVGSRPTTMPASIVESIVAHTDRLCRVLQQLGYVGRCSFDTIVCGPNVQASTLRFVECNGRWGGTSTPMALVNRVLGDERGQPGFAAWSARSLAVRTSVSFADFVDALTDVLYDRSTRKGWALLNNIGCLETIGSLDVITLGDNQAEAEERQQLLDALLHERLGD